MSSLLPSRFFAACLALFAFSAFAQPAQQPAVSLSNPLSQDRVTFYTEPNFKGDSLVVEAGAQVENLDTMRRNNQRPWSFAISSVKVEGAAKAIVHTLAGFRGDRLEITRSIPDLYAEPRVTSGGTWDRSIAAIIVVGPPRVVMAPPPTTVVVQQPPPQTVIVQQQPPPPPPPTVVVVEPPRPRLSPREADAIVIHAYRDVLDRSPDPEGLRTYRERLMREGWSERQIVEQLQRSGEARGINADEAITRIYREVLGRDPDANGLGHYRAKWRDGWTQGQIRDDLRRSNEGRDYYIRSTVTRAYKELLGRDPDPQGYATYERLMREKGYSEQQVRAAIMSGDEYRQRARGRR
jgi:hypothetical protein